MKGMFIKLSVITPSKGRLGYNLKELLQIDLSTGSCNFMRIGLRVTKLFKKFLGGYFFRPPCIYIYYIYVNIYK